MGSVAQTHQRPDDGEMGSFQALPDLRRLRGGFTLIELLITMAIAGVLMAIGVPAMTQFLSDRAAASNAEEFAEALRYARSEALKRAATVEVCASINPEALKPECSGDSNTWAKGWLVMVADTGEVIRIQNGLRSMNSLVAAAATVQFATTGIATTGSGDYVFNPINDPDAKRKRTVNLNVQGRVKITKGS